MSKYIAGTILVNHGAGLVNHHCVFNPENAEAGIGENVDAMCLTGVVGGYKEDESIADAERIEACLNACKPFKTELLQKHGSDTFDNSIIAYEEMLKRLLYATKNLLYPTQCTSSNQMNAMKYLKDTINQIESEL